MSVVTFKFTYMDISEYQRFGLDRFHCIYKCKYW